MSMRSSVATLSALIVDDEALAADEIAYLLREFPSVEILGSASNGLEAVKLIESLEPDVVFLDVQMPGLDGLGVIRTLRERDIPLPYFVMTTAFDQYAVEAFRLEAFDYLLKPVSKDRLEQTLLRAQRAMETARPPAPVVAPTRPTQIVNKLLVRNANRNLLVDTQEIVYATIDAGSVNIVTTSMEGRSSYKTIEELEASLDPDIFWRVHRSFLVNINRVKEVIPWFKSTFQLKMDDKKASEIPVSRTHAKRLRTLFRL